MLPPSPVRPEDSARPIPTRLAGIHIAHSVSPAYLKKVSARSQRRLPLRSSPATSLLLDQGSYLVVGLQGVRFVKEGGRQADGSVVAALLAEQTNADHP
jgi:hypothetical protein